MTSIDEKLMLAMSVAMDKIFGEGTTTQKEYPEWRREELALKYSDEPSRNGEWYTRDEYPDPRAGSEPICDNE
jgi:hypothetical protein